MYVYIWKDPCGVPFYVGLTRNMRRTNPKNGGNRNWLTLNKLEEVGAHNVIVEIRPVGSIVLGQELERKLIAEYGRIQTRSGTLTNLREGGEGMHSPTPEHRQKLREAMLRPDHPAYSPESRAKLRERMSAPEIRAKFIGENNPAKKPETRAKLKAIWQDPEYVARQKLARTGKQKVFSEDAKERLRANLLKNPAMKGWGELNGKNADFEAKRLAGLKAAQEKIREKMADPEALAKRKAKLKETLNSAEFKAKRAQWDTPEYREKLSAAKREYWAKRKAASLTQEESNLGLAPPDQPRQHFTAPFGPRSERLSSTSPVPTVGPHPDLAALQVA